MASILSRDSAEIGFLWIIPSDEDHAARRITADYHLGCAYLAAYLAAAGIRAKQYRLRSTSVEEFASSVVADGVRILGLSIKDTNYYAARWVASAVKAKDPSIVVVVGGLTATFSDELILHYCPDIDACVRGYGEETFLSLCKAVLDRIPLDEIPSVTYRADGRVVRTPDRERFDGSDLDVFPSPYLSGILPATEGPKIGISTSRGCVFHCTFCNPTAMAGHRIAYHSDDRVIAELELIAAHAGNGKPRMLFLNEDIFALNPERTRCLSSRIQAANLRNLVFGCETRIEHLDEELLRAMYDAGFRFLKFGLESGNPRVLNLIKKVRTCDGAADGYAAEKEFLDRIAAAVSAARRIGYRVVAGAVFGLPGESLADAIDTLDFVRRIGVDEYYHNFLQLFPGTEAFNTRQRWGHTVQVRKDFYPTIFQTNWPYAVQLVPRLEDKLKREFRRSVVQL